MVHWHSLWTTIEYKSNSKGCVKCSKIGTVWVIVQESCPSQGADTRTEVSSCKACLLSVHFQVACIGQPLQCVPAIGRLQQIATVHVRTTMSLVSVHCSGTYFRLDCSVLVSSCNANPALKICACILGSDCLPSTPWSSRATCAFFLAIGLSWFIAATLLSLYQ